MFHDALLLHPLGQWYVASVVVRAGISCKHSAASSSMRGLAAPPGDATRPKHERPSAARVVGTKLAMRYVTAVLTASSTAAHAIRLHRVHRSARRTVAALAPGICGARRVCTSMWYGSCCVLRGGGVDSGRKRLCRCVRVFARRYRWLPCRTHRQRIALVCACAQLWRAS